MLKCLVICIVLITMCSTRIIGKKIMGANKSAIRKGSLPIFYANGGSYISSHTKEGCVCSPSYHGSRCQKKLCAQYVKLKSPITALYKGLSSTSPKHTRYKLTYRTRYSTTVKCKEDL